MVYIKQKVRMMTTVTLMIVTSLVVLGCGEPTSTSGEQDATELVSVTGMWKAIVTLENKDPDIMTLKLSQEDTLVTGAFCTDSMDIDCIGGTPIEGNFREQQLTLSWSYEKLTAPGSPGTMEYASFILQYDSHNLTFKGEAFLYLDEGRTQIAKTAQVAMSQINK